MLLPSSGALVAAEGAGAPSGNPLDFGRCIYVLP